MTTLRLLRCAGRAAAFLACSFIAFAAADAQQAQLIDVGGHKLEMTRSGDGELHIMRHAEMDGLERILGSGRLGVSGKLPDVPTVVLTSLLSATAQGLRAPEVWRQLHAELFGSITNGMHIVTSHSGNLIQKDEPDLVLNAVHWVVDAARRPH